MPVRRWDCADCEADPSTHEARGRCGGGLDRYPGAMRDEQGRAYIHADEACGRAAAFGDGELRLYACPIALGRMLPASLPALYAASQGGLSPEVLGHGALTRGAVRAVNTLAEAWAWRRKIENDADRAKREAQARGAQRR